MSNLILPNNSDSPFDSIRRFDEHGNEFWYARELMNVLGYPRWNEFKASIERAILSLAVQQGENSVPMHFSGSTLKTSGRPKEDYRLSRWACYLVAMNGDPRKSEIASAQAYFAIKTRQAETSTSNTHALPQTYKEALIALVKEVEARELLEEQNRMLESENHLLSEAVDELFDYSSIIRVAKFNNVSETSFDWRLLKAASNKLGLEIKKVPCPRFVAKNLYAHQAWRLAYPEYRLPETTTLVIKQ